MNDSGERAERIIEDLGVIVNKMRRGVTTENV